ncbi:MAG: NUDIX hydrolase [Actinomycetota bacterium]
MGSPIAAAGGVVWREGPDEVEVAVIHRKRYDDWTLPKGKLHRGESELAAAVREVGEEIGARVSISRRLPRIGYMYARRPKTVAFWAMQHRGGDFAANDEVDELFWGRPDEVRDRLTHDSDRGVLDAFTALPPPGSVVVLVRHAHAGKRATWPGPDELRPLDEIGTRQADTLAAFLADFAPERILAADRTRCVQSVEPLADRFGLTVEVTPDFSDESFAADPKRSRHALLAVAKPGTSAVICSQGKAIPGLLDELGLGRSSATRKGAAWVLSFADAVALSADYYPDAART